jgi:Asp-tRNA(Asn)/Glu-tRNA(Gln) amidotransferase A subunit family amidase
VAAQLEVIAGHDPLDSTSIPAPPGKYLEACAAGLAGMRVGVPEEYFAARPGPRDRGLGARGHRRPGKAGAKVVPVSLPTRSTRWRPTTSSAPPRPPRTWPATTASASGHRAEAGTLEELYARTRGEGFGAEPKRRIILGTYVLRSGYYDAYYGKALRVRRKLADDFKAAFSQVDVLVTPTSPVVAFKLGERMSDPLQMYLADIYTVAPSMAGLPAPVPVLRLQQGGAAHRPAGDRAAARRGGGVPGGGRVSEADRLAHAAAQGSVVSALDKYEVVIGLEVHVHLATKSKIFSSSSTQFGAEPNASTDVVTWGCPGRCRC